MSGLRVEDLGHLPFEEARQIQLARLRERVQEKIPDTLLLVEHPPVITLGRGAHRENLINPAGIPVLEAERGGDVTLHAPGQAVGYVIRKLRPGQRDLAAHLRLLEAIVLETLPKFGLAGRRVAGKTGVWINEHKIASIGVACRRWCTWHGFALNVNLDLSLFESIRPCGFEASSMTSMARESGSPLEMGAVKAALAKATGKLLGQRQAPRVDGPLAGL